MEKIIYFSISCPKCKMLQTFMRQKNIEYELVEDKDKVMDVAQQYGITSAPFALIDGEVYDAKQLQKWIKEYEA